MAELAVRMKTSTSIAGSKGFTLVELLVVLLIIGIATSFVTLSINTAKPSQAQTLFNQLQNQLRQSQQESQLKNISLGTSKANYIDPRITVAFLKLHNIMQFSFC